MGTGYVRAVQTIADDQTEVASKTQVLLNEYGVAADEIKDIEISSFGANKFLILVSFLGLIDAKTLATKLGLITIAPKAKFGASRALTTIIGVKSSFVDLWKFLRKLSTKVGLTATLGSIKLVTKMTSTKVGLKAIAPTAVTPLRYGNWSTKLGFALVLDYYNHVINPTASLSTKTGLKSAWNAVYNGFPVNTG